MADVDPQVATAAQPKKRTFKKFSFRGVDLDALLDMSTGELVKLFRACARRSGVNMGKSDPTDPACPGPFSKMGHARSESRFRLDRIYITYGTIDVLALARKRLVPAALAHSLGRISTVS
ncbi:hypothetical protein Ddye_005688 [Dipteronia dyeriana]|uniref:40S ribosomal protein S15 n=1 Tax=Dipteronia dyeriana TaxID=168575 RepID=A0AAE0CPV7_9ROSI|nr:hypothetical protein Ddye_005688 [Dipteronia dyeriana]